MSKEKKDARCDDLIDALLEEHGISPQAVLGENGLSARFNGHIRATKKRPILPFCCVAISCVILGTAFDLRLN
jgi:hypothetical protein